MTSTGLVTYLKSLFCSGQPVLCSADKIKYRRTFSLEYKELTHTQTHTHTFSTVDVG